MDLNAIAMFTTVVRASSFSKAAHELGVTKSTVSKKVSDLETELGTTLLRRTTRSLQLTEMGQQFFDQCIRALAGIREAAENAQASSAEPQGNLRITAPSDFAPGVLGPLLADFLAKYPKVSIEMVLSDRTLDFVNDRIDVAIRLGRLADSSLRAKRVGRDVFQLVVSPDYLKKAPPLREPGDLAQHRCVVFAPKTGMDVWQLRNGEKRMTVEPERKFAANSITMAKAVAASGAGIALLPVSGCQDELRSKTLKVVLPEWSMEDAPIHLVYQKHSFAPPKLQVFLAHMEAGMKPAFG